MNIRVTALPLALGLLVLTVLVALSLGPITIPLAELPHNLVVHNIRLPRVLVAALVGAALATSGALMQTIFHNPLADPGIIGVSSGAALGAVLTIVSGATFLGMWTLPAGAFIGALVTVTVVYLIASTRKAGDPATLVLVGMAITSFIGAVISAAVANAPQDSDLRSVMFWMNGDLVARTWAHVSVAVLPILVGLALAVALSRDLNILLLGETTAQSSGLNIKRLRVCVLVLAAVMTATAVAVSGTISFVGLVVPHLIRITLGPDHKLLLPLAGVLGATFVVAADIVARLLFQPVVLQTGTVVAFIGSPVFLYLLLRTRNSRKGLGL
ncbi:FecCD family ABC transporter permease [Corynebacterium hindlerae]|uniref:FecCD family ABC transporter permease n=1 Tax=Corynebacterium hindlerae TaxID=699041 RepID=UPI0031B6F9AC